MKTKYGLRPVIRIKELLEKHGLTQKELAEMIGETPQQVNKWVNGVEPCLSTLGRIAITLGVQLKDLVWLAGDDANFNANNAIYIRGGIASTICNKTSDNAQETLDSLKQYYRWTDEEAQGVTLVYIDSKNEELVLRCAPDADAFIAWAKKHRDDMYRL